MVFILMTVLLDVIGIGIIIPVLPHLVAGFVEGNSSRAAINYGLMISGFALMQFLFAPLFGSLSDQVGRRPVILISLLGFALNYGLLALAPSLTWLLAARLLSGITGASITTANAYIADISTPETRAQNYGMIGAAFGVGFIIGPALGGLLGKLGPRVPFWVAMAIVLVNWLYGLLVLPESLPPDKRSPFSWKKANPLASIVNLKRYPMVLGLAMAFMFMSLGQRGLESIWVLFTQYRFGWTELENGLALTLVGVMAVVVQGGLIRRIMPRLGERRALIIGLAISTVTMVLYGLATRGWMMLVVIFLASLGGIAGPAAQSLVAGQVSPSEQGSLQGTLTSLISLTAIIAPLLTTWVFARFIDAGAAIQLPGAPFFLGAFFLLVSLAMVFRVLRRRVPEVS